MALQARPRRKGLSILDSSAPWVTGRLHGLDRAKWNNTRVHRIYKYFDYSQCRANASLFYLFVCSFTLWCVSAVFCPVFDLSNQFLLFPPLVLLYIYLVMYYIGTILSCVVYFRLLTEHHLLFSLNLYFMANYKAAGCLPYISVVKLD